MVDFLIITNASDAVCARGAAHIVIMIVLLHPSHMQNASSKVEIIIWKV